MTCFLEYEPESVLVHDLFSHRQAGQWILEKSSYRKLRLALSWVRTQLLAVGFTVDVQESQHGMWFLVLRKKRELEGHGEQLRVILVRL
jgi:hypothetical protein